MPDWQGTDFVSYDEAVHKGNVNHPDHYNQREVECIDIVEQLTFNVGCAIKYLWRREAKGKIHEDWSKAEWYIRREFMRRRQYPYARIDNIDLDSLMRLIIDRNDSGVDEYIDNLIDVWKASLKNGRR